jgi:O-Antigen ligase
MSIKLFEQFAAPKSKIQKFADRYQYILSIAAAFLFFSDLPDYLHSASIIPVLPLAWIAVFAVLAIPFLKKAASIPTPLLIWMIFYIFISILSLMTVSADEISFTDFRAKVLSVLFIVLMYTIFQQKSTNHIKYTILAVVLMSVGNNIVELLNPRIFTEINVGRPAGFYVDPNKTGCALMLGMLLSISIVKKPYRWILVLIAGVGIMATFSRGAILGWVICTVFLIVGRVLSEQRRKIILPAVILVVLLVSLNPLKTLTDYFKGDTSGASWDIVNRLEEFQNPSLSEDSAMSRQGVAAGAWLMFGNRPFWGNGLASTRKWMIADVSTHNMYLYYMADHGILGVIFLPGAILAVVYRNQGEQKTILLCFATFLTLWGLFSHEVLAERYTLSSFALLAAMNTNQKWYLKYTNRNFQMAPSSTTQLVLPPARTNQKIVSQRRD